MQLLTRERAKRRRGVGVGCRRRRGGGGGEIFHGEYLEEGRARGVVKLS